MKTKFLYMLAYLFSITSCSINDNVNESIPAQTVTENWHLTKVSGGFTGINIQFNLETIVWIFDSKNRTISVTNNNTDDTKVDAFPTKTYQYDILEVKDKNYLIFEGIEFGEITSPNDDTLIINQNSISSGRAADLYIYTFERKLVIKDVTIN